MFERLGWWVPAHRWWVVCAWLAAFLVSLPFVPRVSGALKVGGFDDASLESARARQLLQDRLGFQSSTFQIVFQSDTWTAIDPRFVQAVRAALAPVAALPEVDTVRYHTDDRRQVSRDGKSAYEIVNLKLDADASPRLVERLKAAIRPTPLRVLVAGAPVFYDDIERVSSEDLRRAEMVAFPFAVLLLLLIFGSVVAAFVPALAGGVSVAVSLALIFGIARLTDMSIFVLNVTTMIGLGLGVDYALFMTSRFREEIAVRSVAEAVAATVRSAGKAVFFSGGTVCLGLLALTSFSFMTLRSVGIAGALVVAVSVLAALTLLPAALSIAGDRVDALRVGSAWRSVRAALLPRQHRGVPVWSGSPRAPQAREDRVAGGPREVGGGRAIPTTARHERPDDAAKVVRLASSHGPGDVTLGFQAPSPGPSVDDGNPNGDPAALRLSGPVGIATVSDRFWAALAGFVMRRPILTAVPVLIVLLALGSPFLHVRLSSPDASILPASVESRRALDVLQTQFEGGDSSPILVAVRLPRPALDPASLATLYAFTHRLQADPRVSAVTSVVTLDPRLTLGQYEILYYDPSRITDQYARLAAKQLASGDVTLVEVQGRASPSSEEARGLVRDVRAIARDYAMRTEVDGAAAQIEDEVTRLYDEFPRALLFILATTYVVLLPLLRSVILPLKALIMNTLSIAGAYGALVFVFQDGNLSGLLRFTPLGYVEATLPILMFCTLFGLSMDYEVFLLTRVQEAYRRTGDNAASVAEGLQRSGRIITSAAAIVVLVAGSFVLAGVILIKALGLGIAIAVLLDATVVRALLVPATMRLLGRLNWWAPAWLRMS